jgi:hypothetical protein
MLALAVAGCGQGGTKIQLEVVFPDTAAREATARLDLWVLRPAAGAGCQALTSGTARPGDADYPILDSIQVSLPSLAGARALEVAEPGPVLFLGEGLDAGGAPLVRGCLAAEATRDGPGSVRLELERLAPPCQDAAECDDQNPCTLDDCRDGRCVNEPVDDGQPCDDDLYCNGPETCQGGQCRQGSPPDCTDDDPCTQDLCDETFDRCAHPPVAEPPGVEGPPGDPSCTDGLDNDCDGLTDGADPACVTCQDAAECDDQNPCTRDDCTAGRCVNEPVLDGTPCDDELFCTDPDSCQAGRCRGLARDCSGLEDDCNTSACDELAGACQPVPRPDGTPCDDDLFCTTNDACQAGACTGGASPCHGECEAGCDEAAGTCVQAAPGTPCTQDGVFCNGQEVCDAQGACLSPGDPCGAAECASCDEGAQRCDVAQGAPCSGDGIDCTTNHQCDATGQCVGSLRDDGFCDALTPGSVCLPECSPDPSGCAIPPAALTLACQSPIDLSNADRSSCALTLTGPGGAGQAGCLTCQAQLGDVLVARTSFDDGAGGCALDGWALTPATGNRCTNTITPDCSLGAANRTCCATLASLCDASTFGRPVLRSDNATNCGGNNRQWRLSRTFDLRGFGAARVCFETADQGVTGASGLSAYASDSSRQPEVLACVLAGPQPGVDGAMTPLCADLPAWADDNPAVTVMFRAHSNANGERVFLGGLSLRAWSAGCPPSPVAALDETFAGCDLSAWNTLSGTVACVNTGCANQTGWRPGVVSDGPAASLETRVDASGLHGGLTLCFRMGASGSAAAGDGLAIAVDAGAGYQQVFAQTAPLGLAGECQELCLPLDDALPGAARNPDLGIRLALTGDGTVGVYGLRLTGAPHCPAGAALDLSPLVDQGGGQYAFELIDAAGEPLAASASCAWSPDPERSALDRVWFQP